MEDDDYYYGSDDEEESNSQDGMLEEEEEGDDDDDDLTAASSKPSKCQVITKESLLTAQREDLSGVMELLSLSEHHARTLLIYYRWNVLKVYDILVEKGKDRLLAQAGVSVVEHRSHLMSESASEVACYICMEDISIEESTAMDCGHRFCNSCWTNHFIVQIKEGKSRRIRCMAHKCNAICDEAVIRNLVSASNPTLAERFERFLLESYIEDNKLVKWCPSVPHCGSAIRVNDDECREVECTCGKQFCFSCSSEAHSPCSCLMWDLWTKKCKDESETINWMTVNTKPCPKCHKYVEKNGGCNLVCCICGQAFCWLCGGATGRAHTWDSIAGHTCGRYSENQKTSAERAKRDLNRYMHYHNRYKAHNDSLKLEMKLEETIQNRISIVVSRDNTERDFSWVTNALYRLFRSRQVLSYSYAFAYYMFGDLFSAEMSEGEREIKQHLFEDQQQQLELYVERLSKYVAEPFESYNNDKVMEIRMQLINLCAITDKYCKKMYECIETDLLGALPLGNHDIASYQSKGIEKASIWSSKRGKSDYYDPQNSEVNGETVEPNGHSGTQNNDSGCSSTRRSAKSSRRWEKFFKAVFPFFAQL